MNKIVCFYWLGDRWQETVGPIPVEQAYQNHLKRVGTVSKELATKYINNLYANIRRFSTVSFEFICFTNEDLENLTPQIIVKRFHMASSKGVLPRMYMFSVEAGLMGSQVLALDLDIIITGSLDNLLNYKGPFCTRKSWTRGEETLLDGDVMSFRANETMEGLLWKPIAHSPKIVEEVTGGRERAWVRHVLKDVSEIDTWDVVCPGQVCSYKHHVLKLGKVPDNTRIISCHGYPRPHQIEDKWRTEYWK